VAYILITA